MLSFLMQPEHVVVVLAVFDEIFKLDLVQTERRQAT